MAARRCFYCNHKTRSPLYDMADLYEFEAMPHSVVPVPEKPPLCELRKRTRLASEVATAPVVATSLLP